MSMTGVVQTREGSRVLHLTPGGFRDIVLFVAMRALVKINISMRAANPAHAPSRINRAVWSAVAKTGKYNRIGEQEEPI
jgi:hypothetical protein